MKDFSPLEISSKPNVLILDDQDLDRENLAMLCRHSKENIRTITCSNLTDAREALSNQFVHVLLLDRHLGKDQNEKPINGIEFIPEFISLQPYLQIIMLTGSNDVADVVKAVKLGAMNYITKDTPSALVLTQIESAIQTARYLVRHAQIDRQKPKDDFKDLVGNSCAIKLVREQLQAYAESDRPILLLGESGTGKSTAAKLIHRYRQNHQKQTDTPFFHLNMGGISQSLAESELFGNEKGAFTDAKDERRGYFELANNGTLFLDEIGEAPLDLQAKLLKVLDDKKFFRLGGKEQRYSNFKLICATNRNLAEMVQAKQFREDLYMRISTFVIPMPNLIERKDDVEALMESILPRMCSENKVKIPLTIKDIPSELLEFIGATPIQGNIRGLEQLLSRLLVLAPRSIDGKPELSRWRSILFPRAKSASSVSTKAREVRISLDLLNPDFPGLDRILDDVERKIFSEASETFQEARDIARALKISRATTNRRLFELGKSRPAKTKKVIGSIQKISASNRVSTS